MKNIPLKAKVIIDDILCQEEEISEFSDQISEHKKAIELLEKTPPSKVGFNFEQRGNTS